jgi:hypothetical protein
MYRLKTIYKFIEECTPVFRKINNCKFQMFTVGTQHIEGSSIKYLMDIGISRWKKFGNKSDLVLFNESLDRDVG